MIIIAHPIIPVRGTRPGGGNYGSQTYIEALQNRNKTNLLDALGSAPELPIIEEPIPFEWKPLTSLVVHKSIDLLERVTGVSGVISNMQSIAARPLELAKNRFWLQLESVFLPIKKSLRQVEIEYEKFIRANQLGATWGGLMGGLIGSYWGALGSQVGSFLGATVGSWLEQGFWAFVEWVTPGGKEWKGEDPIFPRDEARGAGTHEGDPLTGLTTDLEAWRGGAPDYSNIPSPGVMATHQTRMAIIRRTQTIRKVNEIQMRLY